MSETILYQSETSVVGTFPISPANRLSQYASKSHPNDVYYYHNGIGQRIHKKDGDDYLFINDEQGQLISETKYKYVQGIRNKVHVYDCETIWLGIRPVAQVRTTYYGGMNQDIYYIQTDHLNTPRWITDDAGVRIWSWESDAFGTTAPNEDVDGDLTTFEFNMRFPGQFYDNESGMHYNYFRDYEPGTGRYLESDPIGLRGDMNTYEYVNSSPISYSDSSGLRIDDFDICDGVSAGFGGGCEELFTPLPKCENTDGECCDQSYTSCMLNCHSETSSSIFDAITYGSALIEVCLKRTFERFGAFLFIKESSQRMACSVVCKIDNCMY